jgi:hypothetical protein
MSNRKKFYYHAYRSLTGANLQKNGQEKMINQDRIIIFLSKSFLFLFLFLLGLTYLYLTISGPVKEKDDKLDVLP